MGTSLRELIATFVVGVDDRKLQALDKKIDSVVGKIVASGKIFAEAFATRAIAGFFEDQIQNAAHIEDLAERLDISATSMREFGFAAGVSGVQFDQAARALGFFEKVQGQALLGNKAGVKAFSEVGVAVKDASGKAKGLPELLGDAADAIAKMPNQAERAAAATKLFGREGRNLLPILEGGRAKMQALMDEAHKLGNGLGDQYYKDAKAAREETLKLSYAFQSIKDRLVAALLPSIVRGVQWVENLTERLLGLTKRTYLFTTGAEFLATILGVKLVKSLFSVLRVFGLIQTTLRGTLAAFARFAAPIAIVTALYLIFDDLYTLLRGGKSEIGELLDRFEGLGASAKFAQSLRDAIDEISDDASEAAQAIAKVFDVKGSGGELFGKALIRSLEIIRDVAKDAAAQVRNVALLFGDVGEGVKNELAHPGLHNWRNLGPLGKIVADILERNPNASFDESGGGLVDKNHPEKLYDRPPAAVPYPQNWDELRKAMLPLPPGSATHGAPQVTQHNDIKVDVHAGHTSQPSAVGAATGAGVATGSEQAARNALQAVVAP